MPATYSIDEATAQLTAIIARVRGGETVSIAEGGVPVAEIRPVAPEALTAAKPPQTIEERLAELAARGELSRPANTARGNFFPAIATVPGALQRFLDDRNE